MADDPRILIPLDGSKLAEHALAYISALKPLGDTTVELVAVVEDAGDHGRTQEDVEKERNLLSSYFNDLVGDIRTHTGVKVETKLLEGAPALRIIEEATSFAPNFLVISTHGASGLSRWRLGGVSDKVIRGAECDVLVIGPKAAERDQWLIGELVPAFKSILIPLDGSELAEEALPVAQRFAATFGSEIHLVRIVPPISLVGAEAAWSTSYSGQLIEGLIQDAKDYIKEAERRLPPPTRVVSRVELGVPVERLAHYIAESAIDLVIMTSHGRGGLSRTALGSVADRLLTGEAPVLVVRHRP